jgi:FMN phosphatase YigB (HAD superfamily)
LGALRELGIENRLITIGDPVGKPHPGFYEQVLKDYASFHGEDADLSRAVVVGDSLTSDILPFLVKGVAFGAWLKRGRSPGFVRVDGHSNVAIIPELAALWSVPWEKMSRTPT